MCVCVTVLLLLLFCFQEEYQQHHGVDGHRFKVRRDRLLEDTYKAFSDIAGHGSWRLKERMRITFVNEQHLEEAGIDGGGVFKEFMDSANREAFDPQVRVCA